MRNKSTMYQALSGLLATFIYIIVATTSGYASTIWYVDDDSTATEPDGTTWTTAFQTIQQAVDAAHEAGTSESEPAEIWVAEGIYRGTESHIVVELFENIQIFGGFFGNETIREQRNVRKYVTVIDGEETHGCIYGKNNCTVDGFSIINAEGKISPFILGNGGALTAINSTMIISNCTFTNNHADNGGAVCLVYSTATIENCHFISNTATRLGGAIFIDRSTAPVNIINCVIASNSVAVNGYGGGLAIRNSHYNIQSCTIVSNRALGETASDAIWDSSLSGTINNSIIWDNNGAGNDNITSSCIMGGFEGEGNFDENPMFWSIANNDFRLHPSSPCLDRGNSVDTPQTDIRGEIRPQGDGIDIGAYEMYEVDSDQDGLCDEFETQYSMTDPELFDTDQDGVSDRDQWFSMRRWYVDASNEQQNPDGLSWETAYPDIQSAISTAALYDQGEVWVAKGIYTSQSDYVVDFDYDVHLYGGFNGSETLREQRDFILNETIIDGEQQHQCVFSKTHRCTLDGFIIRNGISNRSHGGGIYMYGSTLQVNNCQIHSNFNTAYGSGIYMSCSSPVIDNCVIHSNESKRGGGLYIYYSSPLIANTVFEGNLATEEGGAICTYRSSPDFINCIISNNKSLKWTGGSYEYQSVSTYTNCTIALNKSEYLGGGLSFNECHATISNCIVWQNGGEISPTNSNTVNVTYSCIKGGYDGEGNTNQNPMFWNIANQDYRLHPGSPCRNQGSLSNAPDFDIRHVERPFDSGIDMGVYEMNETDSDDDGLYDDFELIYSITDPGIFDTDGDGTSAGEEWFSTRRLYVNASSTHNTPTGTAWETAFPDIQSAVDAARFYDQSEIWVAKGIYTSQSDQVVYLEDQANLYGGFSGTETELDQRDIESNLTVLDGEEARQCVHARDCMGTLDGFSIENGYSEKDGGGIELSNSPMVINQCKILSNSSKFGGGIKITLSSPTISNCFVQHNEAKYGAGIYLAVDESTIFNTVFTANISTDNGAAIYSRRTSSSFTNCTIVNNIAYQAGGGAYSSESPCPVFSNCILWENGTEIRSSDRRMPTIKYSCVTGGYEGEGNIDSDPLFWNSPAMDFRLHSHSPCINTGTPVNAPLVDIRLSNRQQGGGFDMGAYEMNEVDTDNDGLYDDFERIYSQSDPTSPNLDLAGLDDSDRWFSFKTWFVNHQSVSNNIDGSSWETSFTDIQCAIDNAFIRGGGEIWTAEGSYENIGENVITVRNNVHLFGGFKGTEQLKTQRNWHENQTVINGQEQRRGTLFNGSDDSTLDGFIINNCHADRGGGALCLSGSPSITNCLFINNSANFGGGILNKFAHPKISQCAFTGNSAEYSGSAICNSNSNPFVSHTIFKLNTCRSCLIDNDNSSPSFYQCKIISNDSSGISNYLSSAVIESCMITDNTGLGIQNTKSSPTIINCLIDGNEEAGIYNVFSSDPLIINCTITKNGGPGIINETAVVFDPYGPSFTYYPCFTDLTNCIVWSNGQEEIQNIANSHVESYAYPDHCHIGSDPLFFNPDTNDFRLSRNSPCIDTGTPLGAPAFDILNHPRSLGGGIDMGAYEYMATPTGWNLR